MKEVWPNFFIVGAPRSGTTFLHNYLKQIPKVYMCPVKEPNFFAVSINPKLKLTKPIRDKKKYLNLFKNVKNEIAIGDASPTYLWDPKAAKLIHEQIPHAKIIMILRDPVSRAFSHYLMGLGIGNEILPFREAMENALKSNNDYSNRIVMAGFYSEQVKKYMKLFPTVQIKILIFEEFIQDTRKTVKEILEFLKVSSDIPENIKIVDNAFDLPVGKYSKHIVRNKFFRSVVRDVLPRESGQYLRKMFRKSVSKPIFPEKDRKFVEHIYKEDTLKLEDVLRRSLPWGFNKKKK